MQTIALIVMIVAALISLIAATIGDAFRGRVKAQGRMKPSIWVAGGTMLIAIGAAVVVLFT